jgi:hypothetical protein
MTKKDLVKRLYYFFLRSIRLIRAYNFNEELVLQIIEFQNYFDRSDYIEDQEIIDLRYYYSLCFTKMEIKAKGDDKLKSNEIFKNDFK